MLRSRKHIFLSKIFPFLLRIKNKDLRLSSSSNCQSSKFSEMNEFDSSLVKTAGDRKFYSFPEKYEIRDNRNNVCVPEKNNVLLGEIYTSISSRSAKFDSPYGKRQVIYCDYAASGQPLNFIENFLKNEVLPFYGNTHTTTTATSLQSTYYRHEAKDIIRKAVNASEHDAVIFTGSGCTSAVNKLIHVMNFRLPVVVFVGPYEHHSNLLPWREIKAKVVRIRETSKGLVDVQHLEAELKKYGKDYHVIGSFSAASNVTGILTDDVAISVLLHKYGALAFWDYAAAGPYVKVDMNPVNLGQDEGLAYKDAIFLSPHKFVGGPDTPGILVAKKALFHHAVPSEPGGGTVFFVSRNTHRYLKDIEMREEGGTPSIIGAIRAGMAFQLKEAVGPDIISERDNKIVGMALNKWKKIPELKLLGNTSIPRLPIFSFMVYHSKSGMYLHHNFLCALLNDMFGIQTRSGCACAGPYALDLLGIDEPLAQQFDTILAEERSLDRTHLRRQGEYSEREVLRPGFVRLTIPYFMSEEDIEFVIDSVCLVATQGWKELPQYSFNPETGEWKYKTQQSFISRKWLGSVSYKSGTFNFRDDKDSEVSVKNNMEIMEEAKEHFQKSAEISGIYGVKTLKGGNTLHYFEAKYFANYTKYKKVVKTALKKFTPDQHLIFDNEAANIRWFLLPSEAKQYLSGELSFKIKDPVFIIRTNSDMLADKQNYCPVENSLISVKDENSNVCCAFTSSNRKTNIADESQQALVRKENLHYVLRTDEQKNYAGMHDSDILDNNITKDFAVINLDEKLMNKKSCENKCKWYSPPTCIFNPFLRSVSYFNMIKNYDKVLVCLSGGKDSLTLLHTIHQYQYYAKKKGIQFQLGAVTVDPKSPLYDPSPLKEYLKALDVPYFYEEQDIIGQAASLDKCSSICSFCSRMKRGRIYACAHREGYNVIALGQHLDDLSESFLMSVFHNGRLRTMKAHYIDKSSSLRIIRPFVFNREKDLRKFAEQKKLPVIPENCPACFEAPKERYRMKQLLAAQEVKFPNLFRSLKNALLPLMSINATGIENKLLGKSSVLFSNYKVEEYADEESD